ncbi:uncharacterized protein LOC103934357 isoform X3 [Pyrus x bretschneideri]|uniref:uncharacterized protein LOC103934357 isoform X3 n=1 Tax=Pyrus x bretschneideri TaxID=225117 RepID=UPI00202F5919|nr:uncharacterized protein LOC103934357 isoform X3 [Pyrus x bretschneideri]
MAATQAKTPSLCYYARQLHNHIPASSLSLVGNNLKSNHHKKPLKFTCRSSGQDDYYIDAPVEIGDGFSFSGGKYSDGPSPSDEWFKQGKIVKAYAAFGSGEKAKDPIFGLAMGADSQASTDVFRWFCVESGSADNPSVILIHGFPSQAYSYRKVLPILSKDYHTIAFDWLGFGFSDKPQPKYGFDYTMNEFVASLESFINEVTVNKVTLVVQGYFAPVVVKYASSHQEKIDNIILLNPPLTEKHANLPSTLSIFSNFLLGEIFSQDPLRASDKALESSGPYKMKEDDAMVYRNPYLTSGASGFALNAISRAMKKELKVNLLIIYCTLVFRRFPSCMCTLLPIFLLKFHEWPISSLPSCFTNISHNFLFIEVQCQPLNYAGPALRGNRSMWEK